MIENENIEMNEEVLLSYYLGELKTEERQRTKEWINESAENKAQYESIVKTWIVLDVSGRETGEAIDTDAAWKKVFDKIDTEPKVLPLNPSKSKRNIWLSIAAVAVLLIGVIGVLNFEKTSPNEIYVNAENAGLENKLADNSTVILNADSKINYANDYNEKDRKVTLKGEAFFKVEKNKEKPFIVSLDNALQVKVLGTSFNIKSNESDSIIDVFVATGKVEFGSASSKLILLPGEKGRYNKHSKSLRKVTVNSTVGIETFWMENEMRFEHFELYQVVDILNELYPETVRLNCEAKKDKLVVSTLKKNELSSFLEVIASIHDLDLEIQKNKGKTVYILKCE
tara:strand:+ start:342 stop:1361 length:1020 start_codon:yes stop_codon:yes gene_type:complete